MNFNVKKYLISLLIISITVPLLWYGYVVFWQLRTKKLLQKAQSEFVIRYAYELDSVGISQTLIGSNRQEGEKLWEYYEKLDNEFKFVEREKIIRNGDTSYLSPVSVPTPIRFVGVKTTLYVEDDEINKKVVKAYVFNTDCWGYFVAYIPSVNIHGSEPPDDLYDKFLKYVEKLPKTTSRKFGSLSPYGFYCN